MWKPISMPRNVDEKTMKISDLEVPILGRCTVDSPLGLSTIDGNGAYKYIQDGERVLKRISLSHYNKAIQQDEPPLSFEKAGPKEKLYFDPTKTKVAIVTCGGLCPGLNNVIRSLVIQLYNRYGVKRITGIKYGYEGFIPKFKHELVELTPDTIDEIHLVGGSVLGSSRGNQDIEEMVDALERLNINILFTIGGDGTLAGAQRIKEEIAKRGLKISVGGIPKTIDNDISFVEKSFGFETAFSIACDILRDAHNEAKGANNGIAMVKLMGRDSGFIAAYAALSVPDVNLVVIPEMEFALHGKGGLLEVLRERLDRKRHALVVVAEGAGQHFFKGEAYTTDASGNQRYNDIGIFLKDQIKEDFKKRGLSYTLKYIDPSYIIRSAKANASDSMFCSQLAQNAVHAAMAGRTGFVVANWHGQFTLVPIPAAVQERKKIKLDSELWHNVTEATGQPDLKSYSK